MTGEITLRGRVLPIGGLKEKIIAAHRGHISTVIIPRENEKDLKEIAPQVLKSISMVMVEHMDEVLKQALVVADPEKFLVAKEPAETGFFPQETVPAELPTQTPQ